MAWMGTRLGAHSRAVRTLFLCLRSQRSVTLGLTRTIPCCRRSRCATKVQERYLSARSRPLAQARFHGESDRQTEACLWMQP